MNFLERCAESGKALDPYHTRPGTVVVLFNIYAFRNPTCKVGTVVILLSPVGIAVMLHEVVKQRGFKSCKHRDMVSCSSSYGKNWVRRHRRDNWLQIFLVMQLLGEMIMVLYFSAV